MPLAPTSPPPFSDSRVDGDEAAVTATAPGRAVEDVVEPTAVASLAPMPTHILLVEDNVDAAEFLARLLRMCGHRVDVATDGHEGIALFDEHRPRIVLCDIGLPGIDGYEVAKLMRSRHHRPRPGIIAITGSGEPKASSQAFAAGFDHHVVKPINPDALLRLIDSAVWSQDRPASDRGTPTSPGALYEADRRGPADGMTTSPATLLRAELEKLRSDNAQLRTELAAARDASNASLQAGLVEANTRLVLSAIRSEEVAESVTGALDDLARASQRDALTDLPNRGLLLDRLQSAIALARRQQTRLAVLFIDLDGFKAINDSFGHAAGDHVLRVVARRLESALRSSDTVSRHSGDEFVVLLPEIAASEDAGATAAKMLAAIAQPTVVVEQTLQPAASVGIAIFPDDGDDAATLIHRADLAMYRAKRRGDGGFAAFDGTLD